jgi:hypothetical protein
MKSYMKLMIAVSNANPITKSILMIRPNFICRCSAMITISEIQWNCISFAKYQVGITHYRIEILLFFFGDNKKLKIFLHNHQIFEVHKIL